MKLYEGAESNRRLTPLLPVLARIDGRAFHSFTKGLERPFDNNMRCAMCEAALHLAEETNAAIAYVQSDEISLAWHSTDINSQIWFDGRVMKMTSQLAAQATLWFYKALSSFLPDHLERNPTFDARVWVVPNRTEAANYFVWREQDATKNSISMAAHTLYSNRELHGKNSSDKQEMLFQKGVNWNDYPAWAKRGTYIQRKRVLSSFTTSELEKLPLKHEARKNPDLQIERNKWLYVDMPIFTAIVNREDVIFEGENPITRQSDERDEGT